MNFQVRGVPYFYVRPRLLRDRSTSIVPRFASFQDEPTPTPTPTKSVVYSPGGASYLKMSSGIYVRCNASNVAGAVQERRVYTGSSADAVGGRGSSTTLPRCFFRVGAGPSQQVRCEV